MKIALLVNELNIRGGTHKQFHRLAEYLTAQGHIITLLTKVYDPAKCYPGIEKFNVQSYEKYYDQQAAGNVLKKVFNKITGAYQIAKAAVSEHQCINIHDNGFGTVIFFIRLLNRKKKIIWQINDLPPVFQLGNSKDSKVDFTFALRRLFYRFIAKKVSKITVNVSKNAQRVKKNLLVDADVLYCGVDLRNQSFTYKKIGANKKIKLLSTGVFLRYRNYETFLDVQQKLQKKGFDVESVIIGSTALNPEYAEEIKNIVAKNNLNCTITGDISESELTSFFKQADLFLFLNIDQSWGLAVFEAMNFGVPAIVSNSVGATEVLTDDVNAIIVNPMDSTEIIERIGKLIINEEYYSNLIYNAFNLTLNMTWDNMYSSKVEKLLEEESCQ